MSLLFVSLSILFCLAVNDSQYSTNTAPTDAALAQLAPPCWHNWQAHDARFADDGYTPMVWRPTDNNVSATGQLAAAHPGRTWLLWNEPESADQANTPVNVAATITAKHVTAISGNGRVACCGIMLGVNGINWLDAYLAAGGPTPDVWHVHAYGLTLDGWKNAMAYWWWWHAQHGEGKPTIISETSLMWASATEQAKLLRYLQQFNDSRVESVYWFSAFPERSVPSWAGSALLDTEFVKTALGEMYAPTLTATPTAMPTPTVTGTATTTRTPTATATPTPNLTQTATTTPEATQAPTVSPTASPTATTAPVEPSATPTPEAPTATMTPTAAATTVVGGVATVESTPTATPIATTLPTNLGDDAEPSILSYRAWLPLAAN